VAVTVVHAKALARRWAADEASLTPGFLGAFLHGSINWLSDDALVTPTSDVDVVVVLSGSEVPANPGKFVRNGVLLDVSFLPIDLVRSAEVVLGISHLAGSFQGSSILLDPTGHLSTLQAAVSRDYAKREWVIRRCEHAREKILGYLALLDESDPFHDQVVPWLFGTGVTTHVLLVAGLKNPTVRRRYSAVRDLLAEHGRLDVHEELLALLGCADMSRSQVEHHFAAMTEAFDAARGVIKSPFFFAADISDVARPIAIDGTWEMIERGFHREAMFWIAATYSRCQKVLQTDAPPDLRDQFTPGYLATLTEMGISSFADIVQRSDQVRAFLPRLMSIAEEIIAATPKVK
jgi:hypothetical protein